MQKAQSVYQFFQSNVKSARYRAPGFNRPQAPPKRAASAPGLQPIHAPRRADRRNKVHSLNMGELLFFLLRFVTIKLLDQNVFHPILISLDLSAFKSKENERNNELIKILCQVLFKKCMIMIITRKIEQYVHEA
jgi:hypothetical protein